MRGIRLGFDFKPYALTFTITYFRVTKKRGGSEGKRRWLGKNQEVEEKKEQGGKEEYW